MADAPETPIADGIYRDPVSQTLVNVRAGKVQLRTAGGDIYEAAPEEAGNLIRKGDYHPASEADIAKYRRGEDITFGKTVKTVVKGAAAGAFDAATAPIRAPLSIGYAAAGEVSPLEKATSGRALQENLAALAGEATGGEGEVAAREYAEATRKEAADNPLAASVGRIVGEVGGSIATGGLGGESLLAKTVGEAALGAGAGSTQTAEDAYLANQPIAPEAVLANAGLGAVLGGGIALGLSKAGRVFQRTGSRGESVLDAPTVTSAYRSAADAVDEEASAILRHEPSPGFGKKFLSVINDIYAPASEAVSGAPQKGVRRFGVISQAIDPEARRAVDLVRNSEQVLGDASDTLTSRIDAMEASQRDLFDIWSKLDLKREHIRPKLSGDEGQMVELARQEAGQLRGDFDAIVADAERFGNKKLARNTRRFIEEQAQRIDETKDAAEAFVALDKVKRGLQRERVRIGRSEAGTADAWARRQAEEFGAAIEASQERTRQLLMREDVWGDAAGIQKRVNGDWENFFESNRVYNQSFLRNVNETFQGRPVFRADPAKVGSYVRNMGRAEGRLVDEQFRHHVQAVRNLSKTMGESFELGERAASVKAIASGADDIAKTLARADETVRFVNEFDEMMKAEKAGASSLLGVGGGLLAGGPLGAVVGLVAGAVARPAHTALQFAGLRAIARNVTRRLDRSTGRFFESFETMRLPRSSRRALPAKGGTGAAARSGRKGTGTIVATGFATKDENKREAYIRRARDIQELGSNPALTTYRMAKTLGEYADHAPKFSAEMTGATMRGLAFLQEKMPAPVNDAHSYTPHLTNPVPPDDELAEFERYWQATTNPLAAIAQLEKGMFTLEHAEALQRVYPKLYQELQTMVLTKLAGLKKPPPYAARAQLDIVLGLNGQAEPTLAPDFLARRAELAAQQQQPPTPPPSGKVPDIASKVESRDQELQEAV